MDGNIELQWIRENLLYKKKVKIDIKDLEKLKQKLKKVRISKKYILILIEINTKIFHKFG